MEVGRAVGSSLSRDAPQPGNKSKASVSPTRSAAPRGRLRPGWPEPISVRIGRDHLSSVAAAQPLPDQHVDRLLDELDVPVGHQRVHTAGVLAPRRDIQRQPAPERVRPGAVRQSAPAVGLLVVGWPEMVVQRCPGAP